MLYLNFLSGKYSQFKEGIDAVPMCAISFFVHGMKDKSVHKKYTKMKILMSRVKINKKT